MGRFAVYISLVLIFLGLSRTFTSGSKLPYIKNEKVIGNYFSKTPVNVVLMDYKKVGIFIKTYYHDYKIINQLEKPLYKTFRTSKDFYKKNIPNIGMTMFTRIIDKGVTVESVVPMPPGMNFVNDSSFGRWVADPSGSFNWEFYSAYSDDRYNGINLPRYFGWSDYKINRKFYERYLVSLEQNKTFYGFNKEFGTQGSITLKAYPSLLNKLEGDIEINFKMLFKKYIKFQKDGKKYE